MNSDILKRSNAAKDKLNMIEAMLIFGVLGTAVIGVVSIVWILFVTAIILTQKVLGV